ncbi:hypothetical protein AX17_001445 [Amanita inopinata Kibby_2008]|nr:hypothetical protein AX17_001445 [Amanita inopinata Kibby_2008]
MRFISHVLTAILLSLFNTNLVTTSALPLGGFQSQLDALSSPSQPGRSMPPLNSYIPSRREIHNADYSSSDPPPAPSSNSDTNQSDGPDNAVAGHPHQLGSPQSTTADDPRTGIGKQGDGNDHSIQGGEQWNSANREQPADSPMMTHLARRYFSDTPIVRKFYDQTTSHAQDYQSNADAHASAEGIQCISKEDATRSNGDSRHLARHHHNQKRRDANAQDGHATSESFDYETFYNSSRTPVSRRLRQNEGGWWKRAHGVHIREDFDVNDGNHDQIRRWTEKGVDNMMARHSLSRGVPNRR